MSEITYILEAVAQIHCVIVAKRAALVYGACLVKLQNVTALQQRDHFPSTIVYPSLFILKPTLEIKSRLCTFGLAIVEDI